MEVSVSKQSKAPAGLQVLVRAYRVPVPDECRRKVGELLTWYQRSLDKALEAIWEGIEWRGSARNLKKYGRFKVPVLPESAEFQRELRRRLVESCPYATQWVDSVIRSAFAIMRAWRKRYLAGRARKKRPRVEKRFARVKKILVKADHEARTVRVTLRPGEYITVSWAGAWFEERVNGWELGEPVLKDDSVILVFEKAVEDQRCAVVGWDCNEFSLNGFDGQRFYVVDLGPLVRMKERYEEIISRLQSAGKEGLAKKYRKRLRDRERDFLSKLAKQLAERFPNAVFAFEALDKEKLVSREVPKERRKRNGRAPWLTIQNTRWWRRLPSSASRPATPPERARGAAGALRRTPARSSTARSAG
ncbi:MAG: hypothetical protein QXX58_04610 [Thermofilaceae archaeon]